MARPRDPIASFASGLILVAVASVLCSPAAAAGTSLIACIEGLPEGLDVEFGLEGRIDTRPGARHRFEGTLSLGDAEETGEKPAYMGPFTDCVRDLVRGEKPVPKTENRAPGALLVF